MSYKVIPSHRFKRDLKKLKRYRSLEEDVLKLISELEQNFIPPTANNLGHSCFKIKMAITSNNKGKSGGARLITCVIVEEETVYLLTIYSKSEKENISDNELMECLKENELPL